MSISDSERKKLAIQVIDILKNVYPDAKPLLRYKNCFELLIATILAAQCTDQRVNTVTPALFLRASSPKMMTSVPQAELERLIHSTGFFRNKAKNILALCDALIKNHEGEVPDTIEKLVTLPGIGRKTANVIIGHCFAKPAVIVDTHFKRVSFRIGLTTENNPDKLEADIRSFLPEQHQTILSDVVNWHGRFRCKSRKPDCPGCEIKQLCRYPDKTV
ncbi:MAG: endonuclease III [Spirochaetales bacterium]|nr:endonuclease III [Spirochaetales bacterium]